MSFFQTRPARGKCFGKSFHRLCFYSSMFYVYVFIPRCFMFYSHTQANRLSFCPSPTSNPARTPLAKKTYKKLNSENSPKLDNTCATCIGTLLEMAGKSITDEGVAGNLEGNVMVKEARQRLLCMPGTYTKDTCWLDQTGEGDQQTDSSSFAEVVGGGKVEDGKREAFKSAKEMNSHDVKGETMVHHACKYARCCPQTEGELQEAFDVKQKEAQIKHDQDQEAYKAGIEVEKEAKADIDAATN